MLATQRVLEDGLGNTSYVTDRSGSLTQHVEYLPFGEPLLEQRATAAGWQTDRLFNSKEYDAETGFYYYGARYYDPRLAIWLSPDPLQEKYPDITTYGYCHNRPIISYDPNGMTDFITSDGERKHQYVNDGVHQVVAIPYSDYETLSSLEFDINAPQYSEIVSHGVIQHDLFPSVNNVLKNRKFIPYDNKPKDCLVRATKQNNSGVQNKDNRIDTYNRTDNVFNFEEGIEYIKSQLYLRKSVVVGVGYDDPTSNANKDTNHFINIVGMGIEITNSGYHNYLMYYDNATANETRGKNIKENRLYKGVDYVKGRVIPIMYDNTHLGVIGAGKYTLTEVRRNIDK